MTDLATSLEELAAQVGTLTSDASDAERASLEAVLTPSAADPRSGTSGDPSAQSGVGQINPAAVIAPGAVDVPALSPVVSGSITTAQSTADGKNTVFYQTTAPTATKVNDLWFDTDDGNQPYRWSGTLWVAQPFGNAAIANLDAGKITTGYLGAARIAAGTIIADMLAVGARSSQSLVPNPSFEDGNISGWTLSAIGAGSVAYQESTASVVFDGTKSLALGANGGAPGSGLFATGTSSLFPVTQGEKLYGQVTYKASNSTSRGVYFRLAFFDIANTHLSDVDIINNGPATGGVKAVGKGYVTVPATAAYCEVILFCYEPNLTTAIYFDAVIVQRLAGGLVNSDSNVAIDDAGITVTNGKIIVTNAGSTVIIDGTSDIFKIGATGTLTINPGPAQYNYSTVVLDNISPAIGAWASFFPANAFFTQGRSLPYLVLGVINDAANGKVWQAQEGFTSAGTNSGTVKASFRWSAIMQSLTGWSATVRYYIFTQGTI